MHMLSQNYSCGCMFKLAHSLDIMATQLPALPVPREQLIRYIADRPNDSVYELLEPYRAHETPSNFVLDDPYVNVLPLFANDTPLCTICARRLAEEDEAEKSRYIMPLDDSVRRPHESPAIVSGIKEFQHNFSVFLEQSLADLEWDNVAVSGSAYFYEVFCPASDIDIFMYGLTPDEAIEKIKTIERIIRDALLTEVSVVRTRNTITFVSKWPTRHIQVVLRIYKSISEILTGFDIDVSGIAYDGKQVYATPRALGSLMTQINHVDLTRRSTSYEKRLAKYASKSFEIFWPELDRSRIDPNIFERSFHRTRGLARLLVLEKLPTQLARQRYNEQRCQERGRPELPREYCMVNTGDLKKCYEEEVSDILESAPTSNYNTFSIPYGPKYLCYTADLLLNAEWNQPSDAAMYLHRHPAFFGRVEDVIKDCCGCCPVPETAEEIEQAKEWSEMYIQGPITFLVHNPGQQEIGSFKPIYDEEWTAMAYLSDIEKICKAIVACDLQTVMTYIPEITTEPCDRDYTGRSLLHLAVTCSTPEIVKVLVDAGVRIAARILDGRTALHLAAERGNVDIVRILMDKGLENEDLDQKRVAKKHKALLEERKTERGAAGKSLKGTLEDLDEGCSHVEMDDTEQSEVVSVVTGSFVMVEKSKKSAAKYEEDLMEDNEEAPDYYTIDLVAWDIPYSSMHAAIAAGHEEMVKVFVEHGMDILRPVLFTSSESKEQSYMMTLHLASKLSLSKARSMICLLLSLGASSAHADSTGCTVLHRFVEEAPFPLVQTLLEKDQLGVRTAINHVFVNSLDKRGVGALTPLITALCLNENQIVRQLLDLGADVEVKRSQWLNGAKVSGLQSESEDNDEWTFNQTLEQPLVTALLYNTDPQVSLDLVKAGANVNTLMTDTHSYNKSKASVLDLIRESLKSLRKYKVESELKKPQELENIPESIYSALLATAPGSYRQWCVKTVITQEKSTFKKRQKDYNNRMKGFEGKICLGSFSAKAAYISSCIAALEELERLTYEQLKPEHAFQNGITSVVSYDKDSQSNPPYKTADHPAMRFSLIGADISTPSLAKAYEEIFEAAWTGDTDTIVMYTTTSWGPNANPPLILAVLDYQRNSPFSLPYLRGHVETAKVILAIVQAQYLPKPTGPKTTVQALANDYSIVYDSDSDSDSGNYYGRNSRFPALTTVGKGSFEIKDIRVKFEASSSISALNTLLNPIPVFCKDDPAQLHDRNISLLEWLAFSKQRVELKQVVEWCIQYASLHKNQAGETQPFVVPGQVLIYAIENGLTDVLEMMIARTGAGMPVDMLVKHALPKREEKFKKYPGLTVYGRKRKDWSQSEPSPTKYPMGIQKSLLLLAATRSDLDSLKWALGPGPRNAYLEYSRSAEARAHPKFKYLLKEPGIFERSLDQWLNFESEYVLHAAILTHPFTDKTLAVIEYLVRTLGKDAIERGTKSLNTPLLLAVKHGIPEVAALLIKAGANTRARNASGYNFVHAMFESLPQPEYLKLMLDMLDPTDLKEMMLERSSLSANSVTPPHMALQTLSSIPKYSSQWPREKRLQFMDVLLLYLDGPELDIYNALGDTVMHNLVAARACDLVDRLCLFRVPLLQRENSAGQTPLELALDQHRASVFTAPQQFYEKDFMGYMTDEQYCAIQQLPQNDAMFFTPESVRKRLNARTFGVWTPEAVMVETCMRHVPLAGSVRQLATLSQVRDVAERIAQEFKTVRNQFGFQQRRYGDDEAEK
ncbi:hypothetical protein TD95_004709 [Thielaviopsis punctulata]|uniref:Ankyrin repeat protein n=1 Tax=Thielaviopsis punctulata TaxID=72032 RepID=A0A0F4ZG51_9PEZI|nr:hypothetical protein TD95_004709 [Thielaviopsis punctulata]